MFNNLFGAFALIVFSPILLASMSLIYFIDNMNPLFYQERVGKDRKPFTIIKLRTMKDERITKMGNILRACRIDEIPQLVNIIKGDMTMIGPRPLIQSDYDGMDESFYNRTMVLPGITGWAQINGPLQNVNDKIHFDMYYICNKSISLDMYILTMTAVTLLTSYRLNHIKQIYNNLCCIFK
jgi:lipopolysaccharide/colanic/teichoic acid biosynthesis glycosyltransferase